jgi:hypothetical protein
VLHRSVSLQRLQKREVTASYKKKIAEQRLARVGISRRVRKQDELTVQEREQQARQKFVADRKKNQGVRSTHNLKLALAEERVFKDRLADAEQVRKENNELKVMKKQIAWDTVQKGKAIEEALVAEFTGSRDKLAKTKTLKAASIKNGRKTMLAEIAGDRNERLRQARERAAAGRQAYQQSAANQVGHRQQLLQQRMVKTRTIDREFLTDVDAIHQSGSKELERLKVQQEETMARVLAAEQESARKLVLAFPAPTIDLGRSKAGHSG